MTKKLVFFIVAFIATINLTAQVSNLSPEQMQANIDAKKGEIASLQGEIDALTKSLSTADVMGWKFGGTGGVTFSANGNQNWSGLSTVGTLLPNGEISNGSNGISTNASLNVSGNYQNESWIWFNGLNVQQGFLTSFASGLLKSIDISDLASTNLGTSERVLDKLYFQSLGGYRITSELAATGLFDLNSTLGAFLDPGYASLGLGVTWTPVKAMSGKLIPLKVVFHPITWQGNIARENVDFRNAFGLGADDGNVQSSFGTKFIADYGRTLKILGNSIGWTSQLRGFAPYNSISPFNLDGDILPEISPFQLDWDNAFSIVVFKNIEVGATWNLRRYKAESDDWQHLWNAGFGLSTTF